jgi:phospholipid transport system substrate-binding protein
VLLLGAAEAGSPTAVVENLHAAMLDVMRESDKLGYQERFDRLAPALGEAYDLDFMARKSLGPAFAKLAPEEQKSWREAFATFMVANYAGRFRGYHGQAFESLGEKPAPQETILVQTRLDDPGVGRTSLTYRLHRTPAGWRIIDVYLKGTVSELALRRSDFGAKLEREGFAALLATVNAKVADFASGKIK